MVTSLSYPTVLSIHKPTTLCLWYGIPKLFCRIYPKLDSFLCVC